MTGTPNADRCRQAVFADDDCCREEICNAPAAWFHRESGAALCAEHEANARRYSGDVGRWRVGDREVPYPDGWEPVHEPTSAADAGTLAAPTSGLLLDLDQAPDR